MKRLLLVALLLLGIAATAWRLLQTPPVKVALHTVSYGDVRATVANTRVGTVEACARAKMSTAASGRVARLNVKEGDHVVTDQVLLEIWNEDLKSEQRHAEAEVVAARRRADDACAQAAGAKRESDRRQRLAKRKLVSEETVDDALTKAVSGRAACEAAQAAIAVTTAQVDVIAQAIEKTRLRAPFAGVIAAVNAKLGEFLTPSPPGIPTLPAIDLIDPSCLYVKAPIDEVDAPAITQGMPACVTLDAFPQKRCDAYVRRVAPYVLDREKQSRTVDVEVEIKTHEDNSRLLPGYSADIEVLLDEHKNVLRIPTEAVLEHTHVMLYNPTTGLLEDRMFKPGLSNWEYTEVLDGLHSGERIVVSTGRKGIKAGVTAVPDDAGSN